MSAGARLALFDIQEVREITMYDELELDTLGDQKAALWEIDRNAGHSGMNKS